MKYHNTLADYFHAKSLPFSVLNWDKCSNRTLTELPFQLLHSEQSQRVYNELCHPLFIEASIKGGLLNNVIEDLNFSISQANLINIIPIRNSILNGITAIRSRPSMSIYTIVNRLIHYDIDEITKEFLLLTQQKLDADGIWLCTQTLLPNTQQIEGIVDINTIKNSFYILKGNSYIEVYDLDSHNLINYYQFNTESSIVEVFIHPVSEKFAILDNQGNLQIDSNLVGFRHPLKTFIFSWFGDGIIGINKNGLLVYIDLIKDKESILSELPIMPYSSVATSHDTNTCIVVSGDRSPDQRILLLQIVAGYPKCSELKVNGFIINTACLDQTGSSYLLSTSSRELWLFNKNSNEPIKISYRMASNLPVRGRVCKSLLSTLNNIQIAVLSTTDGELLIWETSQSSIRRRGTFRGLGQNIFIQAMDIIPENDTLVIATRDTIETITIPGEEFMISISPATQCCFSNDKWFIVINEKAQKVTWFKEGKYIADFIFPNYLPVSITSFGEHGSVVVGYKNGTVAKLTSNIQPAIDDVIDLFDGHPISSVIDFGNDNILAVSKNGQLKITNFESDTKCKELKPVDNIHDDQKACKLGRNNDILIWGRSHTGDSVWSALVIRENDSQEVVFESKGIVTDLVASKDGKFIYSIIDRNVYCYTQKIRNQWDLFSMREANADHITTCHDDLLAVALKEKGLNWLELWDNSAGMKTVAAIALPFQTTCINSLSDSIGIGTEDGKHCIIKIRNNLQVENRIILKH